MSGAGLRFGKTVKKVYPNEERVGWEREMLAYHRIAWACPQLIGHGRFWLEIERLTPILDLGPEESRLYAKPLWNLLQKLHDCGYWHRDVSLVNVVICPKRGPLLIDWENLCERQSDVSYDLYGPRVAQVQEAWKTNGNGVWWNSGWSVCPGRWWEVEEK